MVSHDVLAQLRQDITTAEDTGDRPAADRLRAELAVAEETDERDRESPNTGGAAPQARNEAIDAAFVRREPDDPGPGKYEQDEGIATDVPGSMPGPAVPEPPD